MACGLNGSNQFLSIASTNAFAFSGDFTVSAIVRIDALNQPAGSASYTSDFRSNEQTSNFTFGIINSGGAKMYGFGGGVDAIATTNLSLSTFHPLVWRRSGTSVQMLANGQANGGFTTSHSQSGSPCVIGARYNQNTEYNEFVNGAIADFAVWNAALTDAEITALARGFTADQVRPQSLQFYAPLVRNLVDLRGGRTITNVNGATVATHPRIYS